MEVDDTVQETGIKTIPKKKKCKKKGKWLSEEALQIAIKRRDQNAVLGCNFKNNRVISVCFQSKPFNITVIQVYDPTLMPKSIGLNSSLMTYKVF